MKAKKEGELSFLDVKCMVREFEGAIDEMMSEFTKKTGCRIRDIQVTTHTVNDLKVVQRAHVYLVI